MSARCDKCGCLLEPGDDFRCIDCWNEAAIEAEAEREAPDFPCAQCGADTSGIVILYGGEQLCIDCHAKAVAGGETT